MKVACKETKLRDSGKSLKASPNKTYSRLFKCLLADGPLFSLSINIDYCRMSREIDAAVAQSLKNYYDKKEVAIIILLCIQIITARNTMAEPRKKPVKAKKGGNVLV